MRFKSKFHLKQRYSVVTFVRISLEKKKIKVYIYIVLHFIRISARFVKEQKKKKNENLSLPE